MLNNKWLRFGICSALWVLIFVVWMRNWWMLVGLLVIFDIFITKYFSRYVLDHHRLAKTRNKAYRVAAEWIEAVLFAVVVASLVHIFVFQMYVIPSPSMERSLMTGDYLYVSKLTYGPKLPNTPLSLPLVHNSLPWSKTNAKSYSEAIHLPYKRLAGLKPIQRDDVVVFNFPAGDTVLLQALDVTYYDVVRGYQQQLGAEKGRQTLAQDFTIVARPVDKRENYVKRCVALPGDSIQIIDAQLYVNGLKQKEIEGIQQNYHIVTSGPITDAAMEELGVTPNSRRRDKKERYYENRETGDYVLALTDASAKRLRGMDNVLSVTMIDRPEATFPQDGRSWTGSNFGPLWIPAAGATTKLTLENLPLYQRIIDVYEANDLEVRDGVIYINGKAADSYTFKMNYYWMMGDNRQNSADSRYWGYVPEDHIVGKASFVWLSLDKDRGLFDGKIRWNKMFKRVR